jgi:hypothetical protein
LVESAKSTITVYYENLRAQIRQLFIDNPVHIPEYVYVEVCELKQRLEDDDYVDDRERSQDIRRMEEIIEEIYLLVEAAEAREQRDKWHEGQARAKYVTNPATGRQVLRTGRIGRALAKQE